nr:hypothetical protein [uncultured Allomuricauda sp.]
MKSTQTDLNRSILHQLPLATALVDTSFSLIDASDTWHHIFEATVDTSNPNSIFTFFEDNEGCTSEL